MNKTFLVIILSLFLFVSIASASSNEKVDVVVVGVINHGPMQPTVNAIKEVTSKYPDINVRWLDSESDEGKKYAQEQGLTAHSNVLINGRYQYNVNGKEVAFQWFEGQQWTKEDLDAVISSMLNNGSGVSPLDNPGSSDNPKTNNSTNQAIIWAVVLGLAGVLGWVLSRKLKKE